LDDVAGDEKHFIHKFVHHSVLCGNRDINKAYFFRAYQHKSNFAETCVILREKLVLLKLEYS